MQFIVQENIFRQHHYDMLLSVLDRYGLQYSEGISICGQDSCSARHPE